MLKCSLLLTCLGATLADLRMASQPKHEWKVQQRNRNVPFRQDFSLYMEPSDFNYQGLKQQRDGGGYDNFLRSNIDNEQDRRNFNTEAGEDHLPFRSFRTAGNDAGQTTVKHKMVAASAAETGVNAAGNFIHATPGEPFVVPLRWNNPHSSELEANIWIMNKGNTPYVIPIRKPSCSGEGYQDNVWTFKVPSNFNSVASCRRVGECVLQIYAHSVESRMYSMGTPITVEGSNGDWNPGNPIKEPATDKAFDLKSLRRLCLPSSDSSGDYDNAVVWKARLSSDVYNHAYQNSDFSPYAGQQPQHISQNMQAACILKMTVGNFGELGKEYMQKTAPEARQYAGKLDKKARNLIRVYETATNSIIEAIKKDVENTDQLQFVAAPADAVQCIEWRDQYDRRVGGRERGDDRTGGACANGFTCLCHHDCMGDHKYRDANNVEQVVQDAYCAKLEPDGSMVAQKDANNQYVLDAAGQRVMVASGKQKVEAGTQAPRITKAPQDTETCFRCAEVGSTVTRRHNTNTYIPSFEILGAEAVEKARQYIAPIYLKSGFLTRPNSGDITQKSDTKAIVQIYMAVLTEMWEEFKMASDGSYMEKYYKNKYDRLAEPKADSLEKYKFTYRGPVLKSTKDTLSDANGGTNQMFKKLNALGAQDKGYYSAAKAWALQNRDTGSSTAVPDTDGPLNAAIPRTTNMAGREDMPSAASGGGNTIYKLPPPELEAASCSHVDAGLMASEVEITEENADMDGLNGDADCDDDAKVAAVNAKADADCLKVQETNTSYVCPPYPEVVCYIPGQNAQLPTQMFSNNGPQALIVDAGSENPESFGFGDFILVLFIVLIVLAFALVAFCWFAKGVTPKEQANMLKEKFGGRRATAARMSNAAQL